MVWRELGGFGGYEGAVGSDQDGGDCGRPESYR